MEELRTMSLYTYFYFMRKAGTEGRNHVQETTKDSKITVSLVAEDSGNLALEGSTKRADCSRVQSAAHALTAVMCSLASVLDPPLQALACRLASGPFFTTLCWDWLMLCLYGRE